MGRRLNHPNTAVGNGVIQRRSSIISNDANPPTPHIQHTVSDIGQAASHVLLLLGPARGPAAGPLAAPAPGAPAAPPAASASAARGYYCYCHLGYEPGTPPAAGGAQWSSRCGGGNLPAESASVLCLEAADVGGGSSSGSAIGRPHHGAGYVRMYVCMYACTWVTSPTPNTDPNNPTNNEKQTHKKHTQRRTAS